MMWSILQKQISLRIDYNLHNFFAHKSGDQSDWDYVKLDSWKTLTKEGKIAKSSSPSISQYCLYPRHQRYLRDCIVLKTMENAVQKNISLSRTWARTASLAPATYALGLKTTQGWNWRKSYNSKKLRIYLRKNMLLTHLLNVIWYSLCTRSLL